MRFFYTNFVCDGVPTYEVSLVFKKYNKKIFKTRCFDTESDATAFFVRMQSIDKAELLSHFLSHYPNPQQRVKHHVRFLDGSKSIWIGTLHGTLILRDGIFYDSLALFASAHSKIPIAYEWYEWETDDSDWD